MHFIYRNGLRGVCINCLLYHIGMLIFFDSLHIRYYKEEGHLHPRLVVLDVLANRSRACLLDVCIQLAGVQLLIYDSCCAVATP